MAASKDRWEKTDVVLRPVGGFLTALAVAVVGFYGSHVLDRRHARDTEIIDRRQALDTDARLYAQLMSQREDAETLLRKDMFNSIIGSFLKPKSIGYEERVLNLELLAYNFHEALDLAPLFKSVYDEIGKSHKSNAENYLKRLEEAAEEVKMKQIQALEDSGGKMDATVNLGDLDSKPEGIKLFDGSLLSVASRNPTLKKTTFRLDALLVDHTRRRIRIKLEVRTPRTANSIANDSAKNGAADDTYDITYSVFWISPFDFPMIDNTRLPNGQRCAIVLRKWGNPTAQLTLVYFPGSRASLKEKPFFDEAMSELLNSRMENSK